MNAIVVAIINSFIWKKIMHREITEDSNNQTKWIIVSIVLTLVIVIPIFIVYFLSK